MTPGLLVGIVVGAVAGLAVGFVLHLLRQGSTVAASRLAEARLADARAEAARLAEQLEQAGSALTTAGTEQARLAAENEQLRQALLDRRAAWDQERERLVGTFAEVSAEALQRNA